MGAHTISVTSSNPRNSSTLDEEKKLYRQITTKRFRNPHTNFGSDAQGALELGLPQIR